MSTRKLVDIFMAMKLTMSISSTGTSRQPSIRGVFWMTLHLLKLSNSISTPENESISAAHFDHPRELTAPAIEGLDALMKAEPLSPINVRLHQGAVRYARSIG